MHPIDRHVAAIAFANKELVKMFGSIDYEIDSEAHEFWLKKYDEFIAKDLLTG